MVSETIQARRTPLLVLGIETSCDETAASVVARDPATGRGEIKSNVVRSQWAAHAAYGGVVPEIAARAHLDCLDDIIAMALDEADVALSNIDAIAATAGPGLIGGLLVGLTFAKGLSLSSNVPLVPINHLEGHALTPGLTDHLKPPYTLLLVSGGHTQLVAVEAIGHYHRLGTTLDDALGEAFDKTAKLLGLGQPGGPAVERMARDGDPSRFAFPRPMKGRPEPNFSFAGLKTAVRNAANELIVVEDRKRTLRRVDAADICASFQAAVSDAVADRVAKALASPPVTAGQPLVASGGVAANATLRARLKMVADAHAVPFVVPPLALCTDNAAMIAWAAAERIAAGLTDVGDKQGASLGFSARARWPLDETRAPLIGTGRRGAKA